MNIIHHHTYHSSYLCFSNTMKFTNIILISMICFTSLLSGQPVTSRLVNEREINVQKEYDSLDDPSVSLECHSMTTDKTSIAGKVKQQLVKDKLPVIVDKEISENDEEPMTTDDTALVNDKHSVAVNKKVSSKNKNLMSNHKKLLKKKPAQDGVQSSAINKKSRTKKKKKINGSKKLTSDEKKTEKPILDGKKPVAIL